MTHDEPTRELDEPREAEHPLELALRHGCRYSGLRDVDIDARLVLYVPLELCEREKVLPISVTEEVLQLATAYPDPEIDLVTARFPRLQIELVFAPIDRIVELQDELRAAL